MMRPTPAIPPTTTLGEMVPQPDTFGALSLAEAESLRRAHLWHESHLRSTGAIMALFGVCALVPGLLIAATVGFSAVAVILAEGDTLGVLVVVWSTFFIGVLLATVGALFLIVGLGLRRLDPRQRVRATLLVCIWLLKASALSVMTPLALYLLCSTAGRVVLSPRYQEAMRLTPHIASRWSLLFWLALPAVWWSLKVWYQARFV